MNGDTEHLELARRELKSVEWKLRQLETPVDFEQLCQDGVLKKIREKVVGGRRVGATFIILDRKRLPEHVAFRLKITDTTTTTKKKGSAPRSVTKCTGTLLNEAALKKELLTTKKLLERMIRSESSK